MSLMRGIVLAAAGLYGSVALGSALYAFALRRRLRAHARLIKVRGEEIHVSVRGDGEVTVVLDAGLGMSSLCWHWIEETVAGKARVVSFDRPALGFSPPPRDGNVGLGSPAGDSRKTLPDGQRAEWLRRVDDIVTLIHDLLDALDALEQPALAGARGDAHSKRARKLVLVGHSTAGLHARLFCHRFPDQVAGLVLVDTASERQLGLAEGKSVYNSYPRVFETEAKLARLRRLYRSGLFYLMYWCSGPAYSKLAWQFPPLFSLLRVLDALGRSAAVAVRQNIKMLAPHFPPPLVARFVDQQMSQHGMVAMIAEHGSQRTSMEYMRSLDLLRPGLLGARPLVVITRDPLKGAGGRLYGNAQGDASREAQHQELQHELARLSTRGRVQVVEVFVQEDASVVASCICQVLDSLA